MPAPFTIDSNRTGLPVWSCDDGGNVVQAGTVSMPALATTGSLVLSTSVAGDGFPRFTLDATGAMAWGPGTAAADCSLSRTAAGVLTMADTHLRLTQDLATSIALSARVTGDAVARWRVRGDGQILWGDGTNTPDANLYRYAAGGIATDSVLKMAAAATILFGAAGDVDLYRDAVNPILTTDNDFAVHTPGKGLRVAEGSNAKQGLTAAMTAGTITVSTTAVTANSRIFLTAQNTGGTPGALRVSARVAGTSFTITSTSGTDTSTVAWLIMEPA